MNLNQFTKNVSIAMRKHSPEILTGIGIAGLLATTVMAVKATPKAMKICSELRLDRVNEYQDEPTKVEYVKAVWKCYIPAAVTGVMSVACIIGASSVNVKRNAALATAYTLSETALKEYKDKVIETIGEKKEEAIRDAIAKDKVEQNPVTNREVILTEKGNTLCFDALSGRYFQSDIDLIKRAENEANRQILNEGYITLNDFYYALGLESIRMGDELGWNSNNGLLDIHFSSQLATDGRPCLVINFPIAPKYEFMY